MASNLRVLLQTSFQKHAIVKFTKRLHPRLVWSSLAIGRCSPRRGHETHAYSILFVFVWGTCRTAVRRVAFELEMKELCVCVWGEERQTTQSDMKRSLRTWPQEHLPAFLETLESSWDPSSHYHYLRRKKDVFYREGKKGYYIGPFLLN